MLYITDVKNTKRCVCGHSLALHTDVQSEGVRPCLAIEWKDAPCNCVTFQAAENFRKPLRAGRPVGMYLLDRRF